MLSLRTPTPTKHYLFMPDTTSHMEPVRYTADDLEIVSSELIGSESDAYSDELHVRIKKTGEHVAVSLEHEGVGVWLYDLKNARMASPQGKRLKGTQGKLTKTARDVLYGVWGSRSLESKAAPQHKLG